MGRPRKNTMSWVESWSQWTAYVDGKRHRLGTDEEEAVRQFRFLCRQAGDGGEADPNITIGEVSLAFMTAAAEQHTKERLRIIKQQLPGFVAFVGPNFRVRDLRPQDVEKWLAQRTLTVGTIRLYKSIILACLNWAAKPLTMGGGELIVENPLRGRLKLPEGESRGEDAVWTQATFEQVLKVSNPAFANVVRMLAWSGSRPGLICKLEAKHYNRLHGRMDVENLYKSRNSKKKYLKHLRLNQMAIDLVEEQIKKHPEGVLFPNAHGKPWSSASLQIYLLQLQTKFKETKKLEWQEGLVMYGLRHTFATAFLAEHPNEIEYLRVLLGHKDYQMILKHYGHLVDQTVQITKRLKNFDPFGSGHMAAEK